MYTPENHDQMFEILAALRTYAAATNMPGLAERLDDALILLAQEGEGALVRAAQAAAGAGRDPVSALSPGGDAIPKA